MNQQIMNSNNAEKQFITSNNENEQIMKLTHRIYVFNYF